MIQLVIPILLWAQIHGTIRACGVRVLHATSLPESHLITVTLDHTNPCVEDTLRRIQNG